MSVIKPRPKQLLWPVTTDANNTMNQSDLEAKLIHVTSAKNGKTHATKSIGFGFVSHWLRVAGASFVNQLQSEVM